MSQAGFNDLALERAFELFWSGGMTRDELFNVFARSYTSRISASVRSRGVRDSNQVEELTQQILVRIYEKNHLDKYDPHRSKFSTHVFTVINSVVVNSWRRKRTDPLGEAASIQPVAERETRDVLRETVLKDDTVKDPEHSLMREVVLDELKLRMSERHLWSGPVQKRAVRKLPKENVQNTLWQVFRWLYLDEELSFQRMGDTKEDAIANLLEVTTGSVTNWKRKIRETAEEVFKELGLGSPVGEESE